MTHARERLASDQADFEEERILDLRDADEWDSYGRKPLGRGESSRSSGWMSRLIEALLGNTKR
jgi:hypothetical protein